MNANSPATFVAFRGSERIALGTLEQVARAAKQHHDAGTTLRIACFDDRTGAPVDLDLSGSETEVVERALNAQPDAVPVSDVAAPRGRGRPKLGVVSREVSLLPRHWSWLAEQRGGASASLRRLVDAARKQHAPEDELRRALDAAHRFMWDIAGDQPDFEEATRALFAKDFEGFEQRSAAWPADLRAQLARFVGRAREASRA